MMPRALLHSLKASGIVLRAEGDRLKLRALKGIITPEISERIKANKAGLLALLHANQADTYNDDFEPAIGEARPIALLTQGAYKTPLLLPEHLSDGWPYRNKILLGDCLEKLKLIPDNSVDSIVTDPPYGIEFMGKDWDKAIPSVDKWKECHRVLKPGAFAFVMCIPRQDCLSRMIINLEKAGFKIGFSSLYWTYAAGFTKALNISKAVDKKLGAEMKIIGRNPNSRENCDKSNTIYESGTVGKTAHITKPATPKAKELDGAYAGFQPKPAVEIIIVAMKPLDEKTYTDQALSNGKGATWLGGCRIPYKDDHEKWNYDGGVKWSPEREWNNDFKRSSHEDGRFPANLLVSDDVLDDGKNHPGGYFPAKRGKTEYFGLDEKESGVEGKICDVGGYSRYFSLDAWWYKLSRCFPENIRKNLPFLIVPKASRKEKEAGLDNFEAKAVDDGRKKVNDTAYQRGATLRKNTHPTVKPVELVCYLITMGSRDGDIVLDPFCGTATTCIAAKLLNRRYIGIEINPEYHEIAVERINGPILTNQVQNKISGCTTQINKENIKMENISKIVKRGEGDYPKIFRPSRISEVYGQSDIKKIISAGLNNMSLAHSLLFYGPSGTGKTTLARIVAMGLLCGKGPTSEPCCECGSCIRVTKVCHLNFFDINCADLTGIDHIRRLKEQFDTGSFGNSKYKIFVFEECHQLSKEAQNMLLKLVEDSFDQNYFIFCSTDPKNIIKTLRNRCLPIEFEKIPPEEIRRLIQDVCECEGLNCPEEIMESIIQESDGMARNALFSLQKAVSIGW